MTEITKIREKYSFRNDPSVPEFLAGEIFAVMDANCALCARAATWIARNDRGNAIRIVPIQSGVGRALLRHYGLDPYDPATWLFVDHGAAFTSLSAVARAARHMGPGWRMLSVLDRLPRSVADRLYGFVARNRYHLFGRANLCTLPDPAVRARLVQ